MLLLQPKIGTVRMSDLRIVRLPQLPDDFSRISKNQRAPWNPLPPAHQRPRPDDTARLDHAVIQ